MTDDTMRGQFHDIAKLRQFMQGGNATLTIVSKATGNRYTYRFRKPTDPTPPGTVAPLWVHLLNGSDNETSYAFLGTVWPNDTGWIYKHKRQAQISEDAPSVKAVRWVIHVLARQPERLLKETDIWHEGRCGKCGRKLTVPESIDAGFGPECIKSIH